MLVRPGGQGRGSAAVSSPALASNDNPLSARRFSTRLSAPGQKRAAMRRARASNWAKALASARPGTSTISGLKRGRPLAAKIAATARSLLASAPSPYTVSVGNATSSPARQPRRAFYRLPGQPERAPRTRHLRSRSRAGSAALTISEAEHEFRTILNTSSSSEPWRVGWTRRPS